MFAYIQAPMVKKAMQTRARRWCLGCVFYSLMHHYVGARSANVFA
ncbi:hypothetical protein [Brotaphodocola sp.]